MTDLHRSSFDDADLAFADASLAGTDDLLRTAYPGDTGLRQPVHTVYVPAHRFAAGLAATWGAEATRLVEAAGGFGRLVAELELPDSDSGRVAERVRLKLATEPIEDLRIDFEDGYGDHGDAAEDAVATAAATQLADDISTGIAPPFTGIRFKCLEPETRRRGLRTLDLFVTALVERSGGSVPAGFVVTLPKVTTVQQVEVAAELFERLETRLGLPQGALKFEVQVETPQVIIGAGGTHPVAELLHRGGGRITGLHYGTYDYSASLGIAAAQQSMEHPAADFAKHVMQAAAAGTGVRLSDGSTNVVPAGGDDVDGTIATWRLHSRLVRRSLERGYYQGWDLHPAHLPSRFAASYAFFRDGLAEVTARLRGYIEHSAAGFLDEPATARALAGFLARGVQAGAVGHDELVELVGITEEELVALAYPVRAAG